MQQDDWDLEGRMVSRQGRHGESECRRAEQEQRNGSEHSHPVVRPSPEDECSDQGVRGGEDDVHRDRCGRVEAWAQAEIGQRLQPSGGELAGGTDRRRARSLQLRELRRDAGGEQSDAQRGAITQPSRTASRPRRACVHLLPVARQR